MASSIAIASCAGQNSNTTSTETCATVGLDSMRIHDAARVAIGTPQVFTQALAVYRYTVTPGMRVTATLDVPADKDYQMAFFDTTGTRLSCSDNAGIGVDESMQVDVGNRTEILVKVWTAASPSASSFSLLVTAALPTAFTEMEANNTPAAAQVVDGSFTRITGAVDSVASDADDYFAYSVAAGDIVTVQANLTSVPDLLVYAALRDAAGNALAVNGQDLSFSYDSNATMASFTYTVPAGMDTILVWMSGIPGAASYEITTTIY